MAGEATQTDATASAMIMGYFLETLYVTIGTVPCVTPVIAHFGIDPVWFGLFPVLMLQLALITPPVGITLCAIKGAGWRGERAHVARDVVLHVCAMPVWVAPIISCPQIVMTLPGLCW